ncbi:hypothetical protein PRIPAC_80000 [Pristionchus pacificus]|nr:hypothetical protein PRIPAC_80000 [Pristionchus pacificus]
MTVKKSKTGKTTLGQLESTAGPGPLLRQNRHRARTVKGEKTKEEGGSISDPTDDREHVRYTTVEVQTRDGRTMERSWRWGQSQYSWKKSGKRNPRTDLEWCSEDQDALEEELDDLYDLQLKNEKTVDSNEKKGEEKDESSGMKSRKISTEICEIVEPREDD